MTNGYLPFLRPCAPPNVEVTFKKSSKPSDGKVPSQYRDGRWYGFPEWRKYQPTPADALKWSKWPAPNFCLVTGVLAAFDIDVKFDPSDASSESDRARSLIGAVTSNLASRLGVLPSEIPRRTRNNSTSCALFVRLGAPTPKKSVAFRDGQTGTTHKVEFLAAGQQIVIAGTHMSGAPLNCTLSAVTLQNVPVISPEAVAELMAEIAVLAKKHCFEVIACPEYRQTVRAGPYTPEQAVTREIMRRRSEWVREVVPCLPPRNDAEGEWRVTSEELDRELDEDLTIYPDGIFDHGTERPHSSVSFIREFGALDASGAISFGGCPEYGPREGKPFAVIGEPDKDVRRPTEADTLTWLCRKLSSSDFPAFQAGTRWSAALPRVAAALGLDWDDLRTVHAWRWFEVIDETGEGRPIDPSRWSMEELEQNSHLLPELQAISPARFEALRTSFAWDLVGASPKWIDARIQAETGRVRHLANRVPKPENPVPKASPGDDPVDIFGDIDPAELAEPPEGCLPGVIDRWSRSEARRKGVPRCFAAAAAIAVASSAIGSSLRIRPRRFDSGWTEPASLWVALIADPGSAKSPMISAAVEPLRRLDAEECKIDSAKHAAWLASTKRRGRETVDPGPESRVRRRVVDDVTMERQVRIHADNPRGLLRAPDELTGLLGALGAYKRGPEGDRSQMLRLFEGRDITVDRVGAGSTRAEHALMSVVAGAQPEKIQGLVRDLGSDGLLQRFLFVMNDEAERHGMDEAPDLDALGDYDRAIRGLATAEYLLPEPIRISEQGHLILRDAIARISTLKTYPGASGAWKGHVEKWGKFLPRIILTFHALNEWTRSGFVDPEKTVDSETVEQAVRFARFVLRHSFRFYEAYFGVHEPAAEAREIAGYLLTRSELTECTRHRPRLLLSNHPAGCRLRRAVDRTLRHGRR